jgi:hypothetical protein
MAVVFKLYKNGERDMGIHDLAKDVAMFLKGYAYDRESISGPEARLTRTELPFKFAILLSIKGESIIVRGEFPRGKNDAVFAGNTAPIKIKATRSDQEIASDITKRFISAYENELRSMTQVRDNSDSMTDNTKQVVESLALMIGQKPSTKAPNAFSGPWGGDYDAGQIEVVVNGDNDISISRITGLTASECKRILSHLKFIALHRVVKPKILEQKPEEKSDVDSTLALT